MSEHYKTLSAVFPVIFRIMNGKKQVLLHRRANTGYMDGMWDFAGSGHVDEDESAVQATIRECKEEIGIDVDEKDVAFFHLSHRVGREGTATYYDIYFAVSNFNGTPYIAEPEKCSGLEWFDIDALPSDMIETRRDAISHYFNNVHYSESFVVYKPSI